jgi:hypothetical protein
MSVSSASSDINMSLLPVNVPSLCIPRVFMNITKGRIAFVFKSLDLGEIDHIDVVPKTSATGDKFQRVFIHFKRWGTSSDAVRARERILSGKELKIVYDEPWFWKVSANRAVVRTKVVKQPGGRAPRPRPRIRIDDSSDGDEQLALPQQTFLPTTPDYPPPDDALEYDGAGADAAVDGTKTEHLHQLLQLPKVNRRVVPLKKEKEEKLVVEV